MLKNEKSLMFRLSFVPTKKRLFSLYCVCVCVCVFSCSVFGHISYRSDWELVKVDFRQSFPRQCTESDYDSWQFTDQKVMHTDSHRDAAHSHDLSCVIDSSFLKFPREIIYF